MKTGKRLLWLLVVATALVMLVLPGRLIAQGNRTDLVLQMLPGYYYRDIVPGEEDILYLEIRNAGDTALTDIRLVPDMPKGWTTELNPSSIAYLGAGSSQTINIRVIAPPEAERGEYTLTLIAEASQTRTATSAVLRIEHGSSFWLWVGGGLTFLVIAIFVVIYLRFGREKRS